MKIEIEKKLLNNEIVKTRSFILKYKSDVVRLIGRRRYSRGMGKWIDLNSNDDDNVRVLLRNVDDKI